MTDKSYKDKKKAAYMVRKDLYLDEITYAKLLEVVDSCRYDRTKNETTEGISGVLTMAIDIINHRLANIDHPKEQQLLILLAREASLYLKDGKSKKEIRDIFNETNKISLAQSIDAMKGKWSSAKDATGNLFANNIISKKLNNQTKDEKVKKKFTK